MSSDRVDGGLLLEVRSPAGTEFRLSRMIATACSVLVRDFIVCCVIYVFCGIPVMAACLLIAFIVALTGHDISHGTPVFVVLETGAAFLETMLVQSAISFRTFRRLSGEPIGIFGSISRAFAVLPRVFGATLIAYIGVFSVIFGAAFVAALPMDGVFFLPSYAGHPGIGAAIAALAIMLIGGVLMILLAASFWVVLPAAAIERLGPIAALSRSHRLVSGHRAVAFAVTLVLGIVGTAVFPLERRLAADALGETGQAIVFNLLAVFSAAANAVLATVGYYGLRAEKEGVGFNEIGRVFD